MCRIAGLLAAMLLLLSFACAEDALTLRTATSIEEVEQFLLLPRRAASARQSGEISATSPKSSGGKAPSARNTGSAAKRAPSWI